MPATRTDPLRSIRGIPDETWRELRLEAVRQDRPLGDVLTDAITAYLAAQHAERAA
jgi:hypothetical protein